MAAVRWPSLRLIFQFTVPSGLAGYRASRECLAGSLAIASVHPSLLLRPIRRWLRSSAVSEVCVGLLRRALRFGSDLRRVTTVNASG